MYAVIQTGGKQHRVAEGERLDVELLKAAEGDEVTLRPVLVVDGDSVLATPQQLSDVSVSARIVGEAKGPKITGFTYKNKSRSRRRWGHRQRYATIEITGISLTAPESNAAREAPATSGSAGAAEGEAAPDSNAREAPATSGSAGAAEGEAAPDSNEEE
jgi:large subunit ribosomal protein L21